MAEGCGSIDLSEQNQWAVSFSVQVLGLNPITSLELSASELHGTPPVESRITVKGILDNEIQSQVVTLNQNQPVSMSFSFPRFVRLIQVEAVNAIDDIESDQGYVTSRVCVNRRFSIRDFNVRIADTRSRRVRKEVEEETESKRRTRRGKVEIL